MTLHLGDDERLMNWLISNPVAEIYSPNTPVMIVTYEGTRTTRRGQIVTAESGMRRWPLVPDGVRT